VRNYFPRIPTFVITILQRHGQTDRQTDRQLAAAIGEIAYKRCRLKRLYKPALCDFRGAISLKFKQKGYNKTHTGIAEAFYESK